jgi:UDP-N-acetylmuramate dehydrogenase
LVNYGKATGEEIWNLAEEIRLSIKEKFNIILTPEVNVIG